MTALAASRSRAASVVAVVLAFMLTGWVALSMWIPETVPRFSFLPKPPVERWNDGCNDHVRGYNQGFIVWHEVEMTTLIACPPAGSE